MGINTGGMVNRFTGSTTGLDKQTVELIRLRQEFLGPAYRLMYQKPLHIISGNGMWMTDINQNRLLDFYNNVVSLGHSNPRVNQAIIKQQEILCTNTRYINGDLINYARNLLELFPAGINHLMLACSGSEANDLASRIARYYTKGSGIIVTETAYHGVTNAVAAFSPSLGQGVPLGTDVRTVPAPSYWVGRGEDPQIGFGVAVKEALADLTRHGIRPAFLITDAALTSDGVWTNPKGWLREGVDAIHDAGALYIADEVQAGFARTGEHFWGFQSHQVTPDIVTMGKPMGNGYPVSGVAVRSDIIQDFGNQARYFNTFGGNNVAVAAAAAVLEEIQERDLQNNSLLVGSSLLQALTNLKRNHECIADVRGAGLICGVEIIVDKGDSKANAIKTSAIVNGMRDRGVLVSACGQAANVLKIRPPLIVEQEHIDIFIDAINDTLNNL